MTLFGKTKDETETVSHAEFIRRVDEATQAFEGLGLAERNAELMKENAALEIAAKKREEAFARREREIEHDLELHRRQTESDRQNAVREARLSVKEEAQKAAEERATKEIEFVKERYEAEATALRSMVDRTLGMMTIRREEVHRTGDVPEIGPGEDAG